MEDICWFSAVGWGSVLLGLIVFRGQRAALLHTVMTQLSCRRAPPQNTVFKGCKQVHSACTPSGEMNVSVVAMPVKNHWKGILKIMIMYVVVCTALPLLSVTLVTLEQKQPCCLLQGEASLIKDKDAKTRVYYYKFCQWLLFAFKGQHDTADLMKRFIGCDRCHCRTYKSLCLYFLLYGNL